MSDREDSGSGVAKGGGEVPVFGGKAPQEVVEEVPDVIVEQVAPVAEVLPEVAWFDRATAWLWSKVIETFYNSIVLVFRVLLHAQPAFPTTYTPKGPRGKRPAPGCSRAIPHL